MDFFETLNAPKEAELAYARWYAAQPDARKAQMLCDLFQFGIDTVQYNARKENPLITEAEAMLRYMELNLKDQFSEKQWDFIRRTMEKRADEEWKQRFKAMKKRLGWSYQDIALFIGAGSSDAVKASVSRKLPAFAKLAVCVFEHVEKSGFGVGK